MTSHSTRTGFARRSWTCGMSARRWKRKGRRRPPSPMRWPDRDEPLQAARPRRARASSAAAGRRGRQEQPRQIAGHCRHAGDCGRGQHLRQRGDACRRRQDHDRHGRQRRAAAGNGGSRSPGRCRCPKRATAASLVRQSQDWPTLAGEYDAVVAGPGMSPTRVATSLAASLCAASGVRSRSTPHCFTAWRPRPSMREPRKFRRSCFPTAARWRR